MKARLKDSIPIELVLLLFAAIVFLWPQPYRASELSIVPDSVEYAVGANRIYTFGYYDLLIDGKSFPPRYSPWFSLLFIFPCYYLFGPELGNGVFIISILGILSVLLTYRIGSLVAGIKAGIFSALLLFVLPGFSRLGREILTDGPTVFLVLLSALLYLRLDKQSPNRSFIAGAVVGLASAIRPLSLFFGLPFVLLLLKAKRFRELLLFCFIPIVQLVATFTYNLSVFGSWLRNGYQYWVSVPYDYPELVFGLHYAAKNIHALLWLFVLLILGCLAAKQKTLFTSPLLRFFVYGTLPIVLIHLFYFYSDVRFFMPSLAIAVVFAGCGCAYVLEKAGVGKKAIRSLLVVLLAAFLWRLGNPTSISHRRKTVDHLAKTLSNDALIISGLDPVYLEPLVLRGTERRVIPISRRVEYASKIVTPKRIPAPEPYPQSAEDHRARGLLKAGAFDAISYVANESPEFIEHELREGRKVFVDVSSIKSDEKNWIETRFQLNIIDSILSEIVPKIGK